MRTRFWVAALMLAAAAGTAQAYDFAAMRKLWIKPVAPFRIAGDTYYVGTAELASYLIKTPKGDILIDGTLAENAPLIERNVAALGEPLKRVKILLDTHAHFDHAGGLARLKRDTGAVFYASAGDAPILEAGRIGWGPSKDTPFPPVHVDRILHDGDTVALGGVTLTANVTPGHTPGCTSWSWTVTDGGRTYRVIDLCSVSVAGNPLVHNTAYPGIVRDYSRSFAKLKAMPADIFLAAHASFYGMLDKRAAMKPGGPNPFVDPSALPRFVAASEQDFDTELARQQAAAKH